MSSRHRAETTELLISPLLITERADDFDNIRDALVEEIKPRGVVEHLYVADMTHLVWETLRLRRCKAAMINSAFRRALVGLLEQVMRKPGESSFDVEDDAENLAQEWFTKKKARQQILKLLGQFQLDETVIEAEAIRRTAENIEQLDRLLASLESRRNKAMRCIAEYRADFAPQLRKRASQIIDGEPLVLEDASGNGTSNTPTAA